MHVTVTEFEHETAVRVLEAALQDPTIPMKDLPKLMTIPRRAALARVLAKLQAADPTPSKTLREAIMNNPETFSG